MGEFYLKLEHSHIDEYFTNILNKFGLGIQLIFLQFIRDDISTEITKTLVVFLDYNCALNLFLISVIFL